MNLRLFPTLKNYNLRNLPGDIFSGIIIAAVSIPISMGYAQIPASRQSTDYTDLFSRSCFLLCFPPQSNLFLV